MPCTTEGPDWLSIREAAQRCDVSADTVRRAIRAGRLPNAARTSLGDRGWRVPVGDLSAAGFTVPSHRRPDMPVAQGIADARDERRRLLEACDEVARLREENAALRLDNAKLREHTLAMVDRIAQLIGGAR